MKVFYWTPNNELRSAARGDANDSWSVLWHSQYDLKGLLEQGYVEISMTSARALYLPG